MSSYNLVDLMVILAPLFVGLVALIEFLHDVLSEYDREINDDEDKEKRN